MTVLIIPVISSPESQRKLSVATKKMFKLLYKETKHKLNKTNVNKQCG